MSATERLTLRAGAGSWLEAGHLALAALAAVVLLTTPTDWAWRLVALVALVLSCVHFRRSAKRRSPEFRLVLFGDGAAMASSPGGQERVLTWTLTGAWMSRRLCIVPLSESSGAGIIHCVILAARNNPDEYRRLLSWLRLGLGDTTGATAA